MKNISAFLLMHFGFLIYSCYTVIGKLAKDLEFLSLKWCFLYCGVIFILFVYAIIWQQVLKHIKLSVAVANKAATIIWGMIWSALFFGEVITVKKIIGAAIIFAGIMMLSVLSPGENSGKGSGDASGKNDEENAGNASIEGGIGK